RSWASAICAISGRMRTSSIDERQHDCLASRRPPSGPAGGADCRDDGRPGGDRARHRPHELARPRAPFASRLRPLRPSPPAARARVLGLRVPIATVAAPADAVEAFADALPVTPVRTAAEHDYGDRAIVAAIEGATEAVMAGEVLAVLTNPITKRTLSMAHLPY